MVAKKNEVYINSAQYTGGFSTVCIGEYLNYLDFTINDGCLSVRTSTSDGHVIVDFETVHRAILMMLTKKQTQTASSQYQEDTVVVTKSKRRFARKVE